MAELFYIEPVIVTEYLLEACNPGTHLAKGNFGILVLLVRQRPVEIFLSQLGPSPYPALVRLKPSLQATTQGWPR